MHDLRCTIKEKLPLTVSEMVAIATDYNAKVTDVVLIEAELRTGLSREEILTGIMNEYEHNLKAVPLLLSLPLWKDQNALRILFWMTHSCIHWPHRWATTASVCALVPVQEIPAPILDLLRL